MGVEESVSEETLISINMKEEEEEEEEEETVSLCDLPLYSDQSGDWDQYSSLNSTTTTSHEDTFEFSSQELSPSAAAAFFPPESIVFCGKLIPYKQLSPPCKTSSNQGTKKSRRWRWRLSSGKRQSLSKNGKMYNSTKPNWYFFLFGLSRFSPVVELTDIRNRQSRRRSQSPVMFGDDGKVSDRSWGLMWGLIRALSCGGGHQPTAVAAGGCAPPE